MSVEQTAALAQEWQKVLEKTVGIIHEDAVKKWIAPMIPVALETRSSYSP